MTAKVEPNDVDIFMIMDDDFKVDVLSDDARILFQHDEADSVLGVSAFWLRQEAVFGSESDAIEFWQGTRTGVKRGIIELIG